MSGFDHLCGCDPVLGALVAAHGPLDERERRRGRPDDAYGALVRAIVGQQLSVKAAQTIYGRLTDLFGGRTPTPAELIATDPEELRAVGLSRPKVSYLRDLAEHVEDGELDLEALPERSDAEVATELLAIKGLGRWTVDMFLMFHLGRADVLPVGDLGIRRAAQRAYGLDELPAPDRLTAIAEPWRPYRTLACLYLWASLDNAPA
ncbi:MAG: DNA-3-methyladenine glycosylase 2 family protein [Solirubrobacterales bacterium]|nr:DNA-3-methyladenine glycosylase 2 family protein [Solirubrobacterales bacterium]